MTLRSNGNGNVFGMTTLLTAGRNTFRETFAAAAAVWRPADFRYVNRRGMAVAAAAAVIAGVGAVLVTTAASAATVDLFNSATTSQGGSVTVNRFDLTTP